MNEPTCLFGNDTVSEMKVEPSDNDKPHDPRSNLHSLRSHWGDEKLDEDTKSNRHSLDCGKEMGATRRGCGVRQIASGFDVGDTAYDKRMADMEGCVSVVP